MSNKWGVHRAEIEKRMWAGESTADIALSFGVSAGNMSSVINRFRDNGSVLPTPANRKIEFTDEMDAALVRSVAEIKPIAQHARLTSVSRDTLLRRAKCLNLSVRTSRGRNKSDQIKNVADEIVSLRKTGLSSRAISRRITSVSASAVRTQLAERGFSIRTKTNFEASKLLPEPLLVRISEALAAGKFLGDIAKALGLSRWEIAGQIRFLIFEGRVRADTYYASRRRAKKVRETVQGVFYPVASEGANLWNKAARCVPASINMPQVRKDITQELCCAVLLGEISEEDMKIYAAKKTAAYFRASLDISLDAQFSGENSASLYDVISSEHEMWAAH